MNLYNRQVHGSRVVAAVDAMKLWDRLDDLNCITPVNPEEGFSQDAIDYAHRGRAIVKLAVEVSTLKAQEKWRSNVRSRIRHGGTEQDLFEEYNEAVAAYQRRQMGI